ncbi:DDE-type integrase/transposase/recombinase [Priestia megaterium]
MKVKEQWMYIYRTIDSEGNKIDFYFRDRVRKIRIYNITLRQFLEIKP